MAETRTTTEQEPRTTYGRATLASVWVLLLLFTAVPWAAYLQDTSRLQWLAIGIATPLVAGTVLVRLHRAELVVDATGRLRMSAMVRRRVDLTTLRSVDLAPSLPYEDASGHARLLTHGFVLTDAQGDRLKFTASANAQWRDPAGVAARVASAVRTTGARCTPRCWELLHHAAGLEPPPYPTALTEPPPDGWGTPVRASRGSRTSVSVAQGALVAFPLATGLTAALGFGFDDPGRALTSLAGGLTVTLPAWWYLRTVHRRADAAAVRIEADGRAHQLLHQGGRLQLGLRTEERSADLRQLRQVRFEPATRRQKPLDLPVWWRLVLQDAAGGELRIELLHEHEPPAILLPQLAHFIEASGLPLDPATHRGLSLRLGRPLDNRIGAAPAW